MTFLRDLSQIPNLMITRKDALKAGIGQYSTGKPCRNGHISPRYTQSGTCVQCVLDAARSSRTDTARTEIRQKHDAERQVKAETVRAEREAREGALNALVEIKVPVHISQLDTVFNTAVQLCLAEYPALTRADVWPSSQPIRDTPLYKVLVPTKHIELMRGIAETFWAPYSPDVEQIRARAFSAVSAMMEAASDTPPESTT